LTEFNVGEYFSRAEVCALLLAAVTHDVLHPGRNNLFQINIDAPVAKKYDGISVLENQSVDWAIDLLNSTTLLKYLTLEEGDPRTLPHYNELVENSLHPPMPLGSMSESEDSESGLWLHGSPTTLERTTLERNAKLREKQIKKRQRLLHRQGELERLVLDILSCSVLYTDMKSHFLLTDKLEKLIEHADESNIEDRRPSAMLMPHADDANPVSPRLEKEIEFPTTPIPSANGDSEDESQGNSSKAPSMTMRTRRRSVIVPHADDANPVKINEGDLVLDKNAVATMHRQRSSIEPVMAAPNIPTGRRQSVQFSDVEERIPNSMEAPKSTTTSVKSRASSFGTGEGEDEHFEERKLLLNAILHAADISNVARPYVFTQEILILSLDGPLRKSGPIW
jgi:hypothetical protein